MKHVLQFMIYVAYHSKLEISFLMDEFAMPPPAPDEMEISLDETTTSPQREPGPSALSTELAKEQSTVKKETTDFVFSTMKSSLVNIKFSFLFLCQVNSSKCKFCLPKGLTVWKRAKQET